MTISCGLNNSKVSQPPLGSPVGHTILITTLILFPVNAAVLTLDLPPSFTLKKEKKKLISPAATAALCIFG